MKYIMIVICASLLPTTLWADSTWKCQNSINEIRCNKNTCKSNAPIAGSFDVNIQDNKKISVCTKGKCWSGQAKQSIQNQELYVIRQFGWTVQHEPNAEYLLGVNHLNNSLYLQGNGKKTPLQCAVA